MTDRGWGQGAGGGRGGEEGGNILLVIKMPHGITF